MTDNKNTQRDILIEIFVLIILYIIGTLFYHTFERWDYIDSVYFITATITTIGYGDFVPKTDIGKIFTILLAFTGISLAFLLIASIASYRQKTVSTHLAQGLPILKDVGQGSSKKSQQTVKQGQSDEQ